MHKVVFEDSKGIVDGVDCASFNGKRILIAGGTGLIGRSLLNVFKFLVETSHMAISVDCISKSPASQATLLEFPNFNFIQRNLGDAFELAGNPKYDLVIHAAGYGQPRKFLTDGIATLVLNGMTTIKLESYLEEGGTYLFLSTSEVYLGSDKIPYKESDIGQVNSDHLRAPYILGKSYGEAIMATFARRGIDTKVARISLAYGPGTHQDDDRVLNQLIKRGILEKSIHLLDQGKAIRTYCYVSDTVEMLLRIIISGRSALYNVGGNSRLSIRDLAETLGELLKVDVIASANDSFLVGAPPEVELDMSRYIQEFGEPNFRNIRDGLARTISWQRDELYRESL